MRWLTPLILLAACTDSDPTLPDSGEPIVRSPGDDTTVSVFDAEHVYFGAENRRSVDVQVSFPDETTTWGALTGSFRLSCPNGKCDWWDRYGSFGVVVDEGTDAERYVEIDRFITAYRVGFSWESDLTALRPLLTGTRTMRVYIDTWVGPGHENGDGWLFDADIAFAGGDPPRPEAVAVTPVWAHQSYNAGLVDNPVADQVPPQSVHLLDAKAYTLRAFITGHGWNNQQNCAEFCAKTHYFAANGVEQGKSIWRTDCGSTVTDGAQQGTWQYARAGWCPGAQVHPWNIGITDDVEAGATTEVGYRLEDFVWNGDGDQPYYYLSAQLITWD